MNLFKQNCQYQSPMNDPNQLSLPTPTDTSSSQVSVPKKKDSSVEHTKKLKQYIEKNDVEELNKLLENEKIQKGTLTIGLCLALQLSRLNGNMLDIIDILLYHGADPNSHFRYVNKTANQSPKIEEKDNVTILMYACLKGDLRLINTILRNEHDVNLKDKNGKNALFYTILSRGDNVDVVDSLIRDGIDVNCVAKIETGKGSTMHSPLSLAASKNLKFTFTSLIQNGADVNFKTSPDEDTVLHIAVKNENLDIIKEIVNTPGVLLEEKNKEGKKPSEIAATLAQTEVYKIIREKIEKMKQIANDNANELIVEMQKKKESKMINNNNVIEKGIGHQAIMNSMNYNEDNANNNNNVQNNQIQPSMKNNIKESSSIISEKSRLFPSLKKSSGKIKKFFGNHNKIRFPYHTSTASLQIPISFTNYNTNSKPDSNLQLNSLNTYIDLSSISEPTLTIDLSQSTLENELKIASLTEELNEKMNIIASYKNENLAIKNELEITNTKLLEQEKIYREQEEKNQMNIQVLNEQLNLFKKENEDLLNKNTQIKKDNIELRAKLAYLEQTKSTITPQTPTTMTQYLNKKFINFDYDHIYVLNCLSKDIIDYQQFVSEHIQREQNIYSMLIQNLQSAVNESIHDYDVHLYGSHATNLCLPWSDLDVVLIPRTPKPTTLNNPILLSQLYENIKKQPWVKDSKFISGATIPIIKLVTIEQFNLMSIDISIQDERHFGLKCVDLVKNFITQYESLKPLVLALKNILKKANLNDPYKGGISSYGLILMIVSFLQKQKKIGKDISITENNLGRLFYEFVNFYGLQFDPSKYIIIARSNEDETEDINIQNIQMTNMSNELVIIDPLNVSNNVAKSCYQFHNIKMSFIICVITLKEDCECGCHYTGQGKEYNNLNIDHCFLKRIFNSVKRFQI